MPALIGRPQGVAPTYEIMTLAHVVLKSGREKSVLAFHPWIFSGAIDSVDDFHQPGDLVEIYSSDSSFLGIGYLNPKSQIAIRILSFENEPINEAFFRRKIEQAYQLRKSWVESEGTNAYRVIHAEGDFLPGLIVDRYDSFLVVQFQTLGMDKLKPIVLKALGVIDGIKGIYERSDSPSRELEGLPKSTGLISGEEPLELVSIRENGHLFLVDIKKGQKTGFFLDQRDNRKLIGELSRGKKVLNCFSYTGGFSLYAATNGASSVASIEISEQANSLAMKNFELNGLKGNYSFVSRDVFDYLREPEPVYDLVLLDPPAFCKSKNQVKEACRGYKDINLFAMKRTAPGGLLFTSSCSSYVDADLFQKIIFGAAKDAKREVQILKKTSHPADHPVNIYHPEGEYLKSLFCRVC